MSSSMQDVVAAGPMLAAAAVAALAGLISFVSPCVLPVVPGYVSYVAGAPLLDQDAGTRRRPVGTALFILGFAAIFVAYGALFGSLGATLQSSRTVLPAAALTILVVAVMGVAGMAAGAALTGGDDALSRPTDGSPEAGFARDMQAHHGQAVQMSAMVRDATGDPEVRTRALDIMLTQQQAGQMYGWLEQWDLPQASLDPPMQWMHDTGSGTVSMNHGTDATAVPDPGAVKAAMAAEEELQQLDQAVGLDAETRYLRLMMAHHQGGVTMAQAAPDLAKDEDVRRLAKAIVDSQTAGLAVLEQRLDQRASFL